jgi:hypothetical protein
LYILFIVCLVALASALSFALGMSLQTLPALAQDAAPTPLSPDDEHPVSPGTDSALPLAAPAPVNPGDRLVYFTPQDSNGTATIINLYNTTDVTATVNVKGLMTGNYLQVNVNVPIPPGSLRRVISDVLDDTAPSSWKNYSVSANFADSSVYGVLSVPAGVHFDGYVVYNSGTSTINPNLDQGALPLRFSADPLSVLLPAVVK